MPLVCKGVQAMVGKANKKCGENIRNHDKTQPPLWGDSPHKRRSAVSAGLSVWR